MTPLTDDAKIVISSVSACSDFNSVIKEDELKAAFLSFFLFLFLFFFFLGVSLNLFTVLMRPQTGIRTCQCLLSTVRTCQCFVVNSNIYVYTNGDVTGTACCTLAES